MFAATMVGVLLTFTSTAAVPEQPAEVLPVTVYIVEEAGLTTTIEPVRPPGCQTYVVAPLAVRVLDPPVQTPGLLLDAFTVGGVSTVTCTV
jgi:hypothetical protein